MLEGVTHFIGKPGGSKGPNLHIDDDDAPTTTTTTLI
jgi:hypothetical protein